MNSPRSSLASVLAVLTTAALTVGLTLVAGSAQADTRPTNPSSPSSPVTVSADALPTAQINGVAWAQTVVGNTVYVVGKFTTARPAGAAPGASTVARSNILAYDITTGALTSFAPVLNAQALAVTASPDGSRIYVAGDFTSVNGTAYYRLAAFSTATGAVIPAFKPILSTQARSLQATNSTVYVGGIFQTINGISRPYLASLNAANGAVNTAWTGTANASVDALALTKDGTKLIAGGRFTTLSGIAVRGLGAVTTATGAGVAWAASAKVRNAGTDAAITSLYATDDRIYGTGYVYATDPTVPSGNLEGSFSADPSTGAIRWIADCHGDSYSAFPQGDVLYVASHSHYCGNIGSFPQTDPWTMKYATAFSKAATGTITTDPMGYFNFAGNPSPTVLDWFPKLQQGTFTGQGQAAWSVSGNANYVTYAGEFTHANGVAQQGLVRFPAATIAPNLVAPIVNTELVPTVASQRPGTARIAWLATYDYDNANLTYKLVRDGQTATPIYTVTQASNWYKRSAMGFTDTGLAPGSTHTYRVYVSDPLGNTISRLAPTVTVVSADPNNNYEKSVLASSPLSYWPLDESTGSMGLDLRGTTDLSTNPGVTRGTAGILSGQLASTFSGTSTGFALVPASRAGPNTFTAEAWIKTTTKAGGKIIGFGNVDIGPSTLTDRNVYMDNAGRIFFGVFNGSARTVNSSAAFNNGQWHHIVAQLSSAGMRLYVDNVLVGSRTDTTSGRSMTGYWKVGGDSLTSWGSRPSSPYFAGSIAHVALYDTALPTSQIQTHYTVGRGGGGTPANQPPTASFTASTSNLTVSVNGTGSSDSDGTIGLWTWNWGDGQTSTGSTASHTYAAAGTYTVTLTVRDDDLATGTTSKSVVVGTAPPVTTLAQDTFSRVVAAGWGTANVGGAWTIAGTSTPLAVNGSTGVVTLPAGSTRTMSLNSTPLLNSDSRVSFSLGGVPTGGGTYTSIFARQSSTANYAAQVWIKATGEVVLVLKQGTTVLSATTVSGLTYTSGLSLTARFAVTGTSPTTLKAKVWPTSQAEPSTWLSTITNSTAGLQVAGAPALQSAITAASTVAVVTTFDNFLVSTP